ncbi:MAG TPA: inositol monophosphatase family protein [Acidimicrobiia bacterium]
MPDTDPHLLLDSFAEASKSVRRALDKLTHEQMNTRTGRVGQYGLDLVADGAALNVLRKLDVAIVSEESLYSGNDDAPVTVVLDPVDGSTNCAHGIAYYATSIAAIDADGLLCGYVVNQATGTEYRAVRGEGATRDGVRVHASEVVAVEAALVQLSGLPARVLQWGQYRAFGCASLALCELATGGADGYVDGGSWHAPWDYLGGLLMCREAGATVVDARGEELVTSDPAVRRQLVGAGTETLLEVLRTAAGRR